MEVRLRILDGPSAGTEYAISGPVVRLGRGEENDIVLPDSNASRVHAEIVRDGAGRYVARDLGSRNGIFVNRKKVPQATLRGGDRILIGGTTIEFVALGPGASDGPPAAGGALVRWLAVAAVAGLLGFLAVTFAGGGNKRVVVSNGGDGSQPNGSDVSLGSLLSNPAGKQGGVGVGRNDPTKPRTTPNALPTPKQASESEITNIMNEGDRAAASGKLIDARAYYARAMKLDPGCERCSNKWEKTEYEIQSKIEKAMDAGVKYKDVGRYDLALREFQEVLLLDPDPGSLNNGNASRYIEEIKRLKANE